jgi:hypothetical protein
MLLRSARHSVRRCGTRRRADAAGDAGRLGRRHPAERAAAVTGRGRCGGGPDDDHHDHAAASSRDHHHAPADDHDTAADHDHAPDSAEADVPHDVPDVPHLPPAPLPSPGVLVSRLTTVDCGAAAVTAQARG